MTQALLVFNENQKLADHIQAYLSDKYGFEVIIRHSATEAISMLEILSEIEIVICPDTFSSKICESLIKNHEDSKKPVDVIILGKTQTVYPNAKNIEYAASSTAISHHIGRLLGLEPDVLADCGLEIEEKSIVYLPIHREYIKELYDFKLNFNVYTRMKKKDSYEYQLKIPENSFFSKNDNERLLIRNAGKDLYVQSTDFEVAQDTLHQRLLKQFMSSDLTLEKQFQLSSRFFEIILDAFKTATVNKYVKEVIKSLTSLYEYMAKDKNALDFFLSYPDRKQLFYGFSHSYLSCLIIFQNVDKISPVNKNFIIYLCIFHDMGLHNEKLIKLHSSYFKNFKNFSENEREIIKEHANNVAEILESTMKAPKELLTFIREHHGMRSGKGFSEGLSLGVSLFSMSFIVIEEFVTSYLEIWDQENVGQLSFEQLEETLIQLRIKYDRLTYLDTVNVLSEMFKGR